jgi:hypothetical protein
MSKNIVLLSDGTGSSNIRNRGTNIFKLYESIDFNRLAPDSSEQVAFYDDGVGSQDFKPLKILGGAFGWGLARNVRNLYKRLAQAYEPGDKIFLFGFSRGAFTVRTLAALIANKGILDITQYPTDNDLELAVLRLYEDYRAQHTAILEKLTYQPLMEFFFKAYSKKPVAGTSDEVTIEFIGAWDTVDAVGLPFDEATDLWNYLIFRFKFINQVLHPRVKKACHALSIDDERRSFHPLLWKDDPRIEQVWFPGVHSNVGGGYPQQGLSLVALDWMMDKARAAGLQFVKNDEEFVRDRKYVHDKLYDSRSGFGMYYRYQPRNIAKVCSENRIATPRIHISVFQRIAQGVFGYAPGNLPMKFDVVDNKGLHANSAAIKKVISPEFPDGENHSPLLDRTAGYVRLRHATYYTFLAYTAVVLYWLVWDDNPDKGFLGDLFAAIKTLVTPDSLLDKLALLFWDNPWLVGIGVVIFGCSVYFWAAMAKAFSRFWFPLRFRLKPLV